MLTVVTGLHAEDTTGAAVLVSAPADLDDRQQMLAEFAELQRKDVAIAELAEVGTAAFGTVWRGTSSDWSALRNTADWIQANGHIRPLSSRIDDRAKPAADAALVETNAKALLEDLTAIGEQLRLDLGVPLGRETFAATPLADLRAHLERRHQSDERLTQ